MSDNAELARGRALERRCPARVGQDDWQQAVGDGRKFLALLEGAGRTSGLDSQRRVRPRAGA
jgi:hypothetical protein